MNTSIEAGTKDRRDSDRSSGADTHEVIHILHSMGRLLRLLPRVALSMADRRTAAPHMIDEAPRLVGSMVRLLQGHGADLPEAQEDPTQLYELQRQAEVYKMVRASAFQIFMLANDAYLASQSEAVSRTRAALRRLRLSTRYLYRVGDPVRIRREALTARVEAFDPKAPTPGKPRSADHAAR